MHSLKIEDSTNLSRACDSFLDEIGVWICDCVQEFGDKPPTEGHDQGTFTTGWAPYITACSNEVALSFMKDLRDKIRDLFNGNGTWRHGYWVTQEAHHGTEHYELFLGTLWTLDPDDAETVGQFIDAAEHMGNWVSEIEPWFDWERGVFRSMYFGTGGVRTEPGDELNSPEHFRCVNICLRAYEMTGEDRYLALSSEHAAKWVSAIMADSLPVGLKAEGGVYELVGREEKAYRGFVGQLGEVTSDVDRAENFLASGVLESLLALWRLTGESQFLDANERLLIPISTQLDDADAGPAAHAVRAHRRATGKDQYDEAVLASVEKLSPYDFTELAIDPTPDRDSKPPGIGKRSDMPNWFEDKVPRRHNPILLALAAEIAGDERLAARAVDLARTYFCLAREVYPHGRGHGCAARSISAIARGHGRDNHAGMVTAVLAPLLETFEP